MLRRLPEAFERKTWALTRPRGSGSWVNHKALIISSWPKTHHGQWISRLIFLWRIDENWCPLTGLPNDLLRDSVLKRCMHFIYLIFSSHNHITFLSTMVCLSLAGTQQSSVLCRGKGSDSESWFGGKSTEMKKTLQNAEAADWLIFLSNEIQMGRGK